MMPLENDTWICHACKERRDDDRIAVHSFPIDALKGAVRNVRYCNDRAECWEGALEIERKLNGKTQ